VRRYATSGAGLVAVRRRGRRDQPTGRTCEIHSIVNTETAAS
jgi:hypothetical protein